MARSIVLLVIAACLLVGCQQKPATVGQIPAPNLDGPVVVAPRTPPPSGPAPQVRPPAAPPRSSSAPRGWVPTAQANAWQWIVIHHSATPAGSAATFDRQHRQKGWDELAYHFVIGNGTSSGDGQIEVGSRWPKQKWGAHTKTADNRFNNYGIGICLVGNFDIDRPTPAQMRSLARLTGYLMKTYRIPANRVIGHGEAKPTDCPGRNMSVAEVRRLATRVAQQMEQEGSALAHSGGAAAAVR